VVGLVAVDGGAAAAGEVGAVAVGDVAVGDVDGGDAEGVDVVESAAAGAAPTRTTMRTAIATRSIVVTSSRRSDVEQW
jgi:hypothetical protein